MSDTSKLGTVVENELCELFCQKNSLVQLRLPKIQVKDIFNKMEPDLIAYNSQQKTLYLGEATTSGFLGQRGGDFHVGAVKKVFEAFSKFYLFFDDLDNIIKKTSQLNPEIEIKTLNCVFIVPNGSRFINALGFRKRLFEKGYMTLETIELTKETEKLMIQILLDAKNENV